VQILLPIQHINQDLFTIIIMGPKEIYLILYNLVLCGGWRIVLLLSVQTLAKGILEDGSVVEALSNVYATKGLGLILTFLQTAALLEIIHAGIGLVRLPVIVTAMQVSSRIVALGALNYSPEAQSKVVHNRFNST
jgi:very-long-chain (3R)-3-hydroxyacyl-CoA dehydratase